MAAPTRESTLVLAIKRAILAAYPGAWVTKIHGSPYQEAGIPDLIGCVEGAFIALEVKLQRVGETAHRARSRVTPAQAAQIDRIRAAGGVAAAVLSVDEALQVVARAVDNLRKPVDN